ncbi:cytochrome c [Maribius pontilimi]|uniref:Cytochrome c n=1 Tax=Palleronia pontilimi TaxID=1964209 RepID=A0A934IE47_9RHOB|nr:cytochrome c [Palleronia pontilimi]MBJ3761502.1 cytochrome c [Palleronia pontilimi]
MKIHTILAAATAAAIATTAIAHEGATGIVLERMKAMSAMREAVKEMTPMMRGQVQYDADAVRAAAQTIESHAGQAMIELFPEDASREKSYAKDALWQDFDRFADLAMQLETQTRGLALAAANGLGGDQGGSGGMMGTSSMMGQDTSAMMGGASGDTLSAEALADMPADAVFEKVSQTCSACHTPYRTKPE